MNYSRKPIPLKKAAGGAVSCEDFKGSAHAFREFMRREQDAIERGERMGVSVKWATADPRHTMIGWLRGQWLRGVRQRLNRVLPD
jgi:hypothetical protein